MDNQKLVNKMIELVAGRSIEKSSQVLSKMLRQGAKIDLKRISFMDVSEVTKNVNENSREVIGAFVDLVGDVSFKFLFFVGIKDSFVLTDLFLGQEIGTTTETDEMTKSAVQEIGNILSSAISNVFAADFQIDIKPAPPVVTLDYSGALFEAFILESALQSDDVLLIESIFKILKCDLDCQMCLLPVSDVEEVLGFVSGKENTKILVIDDSETNGCMYQAMLEEEGFAVDVVLGAEEAFELMSKKYFDVILCDYCMPGINGEQFLQMVRENPRLRHNIVIIITSDEREDTKIRLLRNGANDFILKGASYEEICARITAHLKVSVTSRLAVANKESEEKLLKGLKQATQLFDTFFESLKIKVENIKNAENRLECLDALEKTNLPMNTIKALIEKSGNKEGLL